jgi:hypothetical protein
MQFNARIKNPSYIHENWTIHRKIAGYYKSVRFELQKDAGYVASKLGSDAVSELKTPQSFIAYDLTPDQIAELEGVGFVEIEMIGNPTGAAKIIENVEKTELSEAGSANAKRGRPKKAVKEDPEPEENLDASLLD